MIPEFERKRTYIERLRNDPRTRAMRDGWIAQATAEAEQRYPGRLEAGLRMHYAASRVLELAMSFILDNDGELAMTRRELVQAQKALAKHIEMAPRPIIIPRPEESAD